MEILVATTLLNHERPDLVLDAVRKMFPDWAPENMPERGAFPTNSPSVRLVSNVESLDAMIGEARNHRILDTALDAMTLKSDGEISTFSLSRQAAAAGKCSFVVDAIPLGGTIDITIKENDLDDYLTKLTYHPGRDSVPRQPGDDLAMNDDGSSTEWIDTRRL
ncbi:MAG: hypothetical protein CBD52_002485 [Euryarchaeota archaeon TMED192]|nr:MAG: hypothetical protein CBD52_002485 [Euryarchaeota archaeon TMED192]|tara:strand:- start:2478 stop:2966 length:489 start_codon:yes stop_codon:yes gene_type:complete